MTSFVTHGCFWVSLFKAHSTPRERGCTMCVKRPVSGGSGLLPCPLKSENPQFSSINDIGVYCQPFFENFIFSPGFLHFSSFLSHSFLYNIHFCFYFSLSLPIIGAIPSKQTAKEHYFHYAVFQQINFLFCPFVSQM